MLFSLLPGEMSQFNEHMFLMGDWLIVWFRLESAVAVNPWLLLVGVMLSPWKHRWVFNHDEKKSSIRQKRVKKLLEKSGKQKNGKYTTHGSFGCYQLPIYNAIYTDCTIVTPSITGRANLVGFYSGLWIDLFFRGIGVEYFLTLFSAVHFSQQLTLRGTFTKLLGLGWIVKFTATPKFNSKSP